MKENNENRRPEDIESDIERTRADFSSTIDAIQSKLTPRELKHQAMDYALSTTPGAFSANLVNTVRDNPIPVTLIGIGIAWLMASNKKAAQHTTRTHRQRVVRPAAYYPEDELAYDSAYDSGAYYDEAAARGSEEGMLHRAAAKTSEAGQGLKDKASEVGQRVSESASAMSQRVQQAGQTARARLQESKSGAQTRMSELSHRSREQYYRAKDRAGQYFDEQPLVAGALGIAIGAALGAAIPVTRRENELMGKTRDELLGRAKETAREQAEHVKQSAQRVADVAKQEAERFKEDTSASAGMQGKEAGADSARYGGTSAPPSIH